MPDYELPTTVDFNFHSGTIELDCTIYFKVLSWGSKGSRDEPASGPETEVIKVWIDEIETYLDHEQLDDVEQYRLEDEVEEYVCSGRLQYDLQRAEEDYEAGG